MSSTFNDTWTPGFLEAIESRDTVDFLKDIRSQMRRTMIKNYEPTKLDQQTEFNAICLRQLKTQTTTGKDIIRIKARIPELHSMLPIPSSATDWSTIELYPTFQGIANDFSPPVQDEAISPGTRLVVTYENMENFGGPSIVRLFNIKDVNGDGDTTRKRRGRARRPFPRGNQHPTCKELKKSGNGGKTLTKIKPKKFSAVRWKPDLSKNISNDSKYENGKFGRLANVGKKAVADVKAGALVLNSSDFKGERPHVYFQGGPAGGIAGKPSVADDHVELQRACKKLKLFEPTTGNGGSAVWGNGSNKGRMSTSGEYIYITKGWSEFCRFSIFSMHKLGRAFDLNTRTGLFGKPTADGTQFLVTLGPDANQDKAYWQAKSSQFFKYSLIDGSGPLGKYEAKDDFKNANHPTDWQNGVELENARVNWPRGKRHRRKLGKFTVWAKTTFTDANPPPPDAVVKGVKPQKVTLQVARMTRLPPRRGWFFNSETYEEWTGWAFNFTKLCKKFEFYPISCYEAESLGKNVRIKTKNINNNEWHHFQNHRGLVAWSTHWGDEIMRCGFSPEQMRSEWNETNEKMWDFYKGAVWTGRTWRR